MTWADAVKKEYKDYWDTVKRMDKEVKSEQYKNLKKYALETKKARKENERKLHSIDR